MEKRDVVGGWGGSKVSAIVDVAVEEPSQA